MQLHQLHPDVRLVDDADLPRAFDFAALAPPDRPYLVINMVASADGRATIEGVTEKLSSPADKAVFFALRASVDAVLAGTGTLHAEQYGRLVRRPERQAQRVQLGLEPEPIALVLSRSGQIPSFPLLDDPDARPLVLTGDDAEPRRALEHVRAEHGVRTILCEGGPRLNAGLLAAGVVDELFLTISPLLAGTPDPLTIIEGGAGEPVDLELVSVMESDSELFLRYRLRRS
jgi:5-amino-6-(5-phosphoribosylamino)uracil reductase